jgi:hypothetical protein
LGHLSFKISFACSNEDVKSFQQVLEDVKKMISFVLVKKQEASKRKKKNELFNILKKMMKMKGKKLA